MVRGCLVGFAGGSCESERGYSTCNACLKYQRRVWYHDTEVVFGIKHIVEAEHHDW
jgi:hypothetical protein